MQYSHSDQSRGTAEAGPGLEVAAAEAWRRAVAAERAAERQAAESGGGGDGRQTGLEAWLEVADLYGRAEELLPADHRLAANRGNALWIADRPQRALEAYRRAVQLAPSDPVVYRGLGNVHLDCQAFEAAERAYRRSLQLEPAALTGWNLSQLLIGLERYVEGYALAEQRWQLPSVAAWRDPATAWAGEPEGWSGPLLLWSEQGLGDTLQHLRWIGPLVLRRGPMAPPLVLEVEPCLVGLLQHGLAHLQSPPLVRPKPAAGPEPWPHAHLSLLSLPVLLGDAPLPAGASNLDAPHWMPPRPLPPAPQPWRVGLVWAAGRKLDQPVTAREYRRRSLGADRELADPWRDRVAAELPADADFAATAAVVAELDLVISVDTAMAHLVGAMGRRGWVLLPFSAAPRWLRQRSDSPWYPSLRLFRQPETGDWAAVVQAVLQALDRERQTASPAATSPGVLPQGH